MAEAGEGALGQMGTTIARAVTFQAAVGRLLETQLAGMPMAY